MSDPIDEVSSRKKRVDAIKAYYEYLAEIDAYEEEVENLEVEDLILQVCAKDRELQFGRKVAHINSRYLLQGAQNETSNEKASVFRDPKGLFLDTAGVVCHVAAVGFGPGFTAIGQAFTTSAQYREKVIRSREEVLSHSYQRMRDVVSDHSQQKQSAEKNEDQDGNAIDRMIQNSRRQGELVAGQ
jgi:hypothetical protein